LTAAECADLLVFCDFSSAAQCDRGLKAEPNRVTMTSNAFAVVYVDRKTPVTGFLDKNLDGLKSGDDSNETEHNLRTIMAAFGQGTSLSHIAACHFPF
jgi:hypothetical protein